MAYQVLASKYRPQTFDEVVGQEAVTRTLENSIEKGRIANAYLFSGPRGVGKTSVARLIAKTINCFSPGPHGPCNKCVQCLEITRGSSMDVLEIDGASNRGIDEIRTLRDNVKFSPASGKYKVYIIDEVHMLTPEAFNALLKTLEEPPEHVRFIFATTEAHKVIATITSRCQRFDFKRIPPAIIYEKLLKIAESEKIKIDDKAALLISRSADGSMRDALVVMDQMVSFCEGSITETDVLELLGMLHKDSLYALAGAIIDKDPRKTALILDDIISAGKDPVFVANNLILYFRDILIIKTAGGPTNDMAFHKDELVRMNGICSGIEIQEIMYILQTLSHCVMLMKGSTFPRAPLEIALIKIARRDDILSLADIIKRIEAIEEGSGFMDMPTRPGVDVVTSGENPRKEYEKYPDVDSSVHKKKGETVLSSDNPREASDTCSWDKALKIIKTKKIFVYTCLGPAKPVEFGKEKIILGFDESHGFNKDVLEAGENKIFLEEAFADILGGNPKIEFTILESSQDGNESKEEKDKKISKVREASNPAIESAMDVFGGKIIRDQII